MDKLSARIYTTPSYDSRSEIHFVVEFLNNTSHPVSISGDPTAAFRINGEATGKKEKTGRKPSFRVPPKSSVIKKVSLGKRRLHTGHHDIELAGANLTVKGGKTKTPIKLKDTRSRIHVTGRKVGSAIDFGGTAHTLIQPFMLTRALPEGLAAPRICRVVGGSPQQQDMVRAAHEDGYLLAVNALNVLGNDTRYRTWFGTFSDLGSRVVRDTLRHVVDDFLHDTFSYEIKVTGCGESDIGFTQPGSRTISLCPLFFSLDPHGSGSMAGRVVHEHSHASADTLDIREVRSECLDLAAGSPSQAVRNAASYQFFAEG